MLNQYEPESMRLLRLHKKWADGMTVIWQTITIGLFIGVYWLMSQMHVSDTDRILALLLLMAVVVSAAVWQAVSLGVYRVHLINRGIDLDPPKQGKL